MYSITNYFANSTTLEFTNLQTKQSLASKFPIIKRKSLQTRLKSIIKGFRGDLIL